MELAPASHRFVGIGLLPALLWGAAFATAYVQAPLYYSNQNQYFLHALAASGRGELAHDWLANTRDPTPVFSTAVQWTYSHLGEWAFYAVYFVLMGIYFVSLVALIDATIGLPHRQTARFVFLSLLVIVTAALTRKLSLQISGIDIPRLLHYGLAGQYILGPGLQPSAFGVMLVASMAFFVRGRLILAAATAAAACTMHATYLLPAAFLTTAYMVVLAREGRMKAALALGAGTLLAVMPIVIFGLSAFAPTTPDQFNEAQHLLVYERIPHHAVVADWWDRTAQMQVAWVALAIVLSVRTRLLPLLAIPAIAAVVLTLVQVKSGSSALALIFPWRISAVLLPIATAVVLARLASASEPVLGRWPAVASAVLLAAAVIGGIVMSKPGLADRADETELPLLNHVRENLRPGDVYLIPVTLPEAGATLGGSMTLRSIGGTKVPVDLQRFRLSTGAPIYVDFKSIPYLDVEVLEWNRRLQQAKNWYEFRHWSKLRDDLAKEGITHIVVPADAKGNFEGLTLAHADDAYRVYRLRR